jgi:hypothetical protein
LKQGLTVALDQTDQLPGTDNHDTQPHLRKWQSTDSKKWSLIPLPPPPMSISLDFGIWVGVKRRLARLSAAVHVSLAQVQDI